ncbi:MAG TPA: S53 family peptidase [Acidimicrobiales bacterium]|nr:S53 family peptidase [Acidimicrobiales bacterium]
MHFRPTNSRVTGVKGGSGSPWGRPRRAVSLLAGSLLAGGLLLAPALAGPSEALTSSALTSSGTQLVPSVLAGLSLATLDGPAPASQEIGIAVSLQRPDSAGEIQLYNELYDPSSSQYQQFLTPAQFDQEFGVPASQSSAVENWLEAGGLSIETDSPAGDYFTARGTVTQLDSLFDVSIGDYSFDGFNFYANNVAPSVPTDLPIDAVIGLDNVRQFSLAPLTGSVTNMTSSDTLSTSVGPQAGSQKDFTPQELWGLYDDPGASTLTNSNGASTPSTLESTKTDVGQGQTMGVFGEGETSSVIDQLRLFEQAMGLPRVPVRVVDTEGGPQSAYSDNSGSVEWYLDSQSSTGMSPDVSQLDLYFAKSLFDADVFADMDDWANDPNGPRQMNASFGECEENPTNPVTGPLAQQPYGTELGDELEAVGDPILRQATLEGRTLFTSAGDTGSGCPEVAAPLVGAGNGLAIQPVPMVSFPCDSPYAVCVGGTVLSANGTTYPESSQRVAETSWTFGGGGSSYFIPEPSFQVGVANVNHPCISTPSGDPYSPASAPTCRGVPDVADISGNETGDGYFIYSDGEPSSEGGTSLSSPLMMGQWTRVQAAAPQKVQKSGGLGFADETIYRQAASADSCSSALTATAAQTAACTSAPYSRDFFDVTQSEYGAGNGAYQPGPGWDYTSGWGSLNVANFAQDVDGSTNATLPYAGTEKAALTVTKATMTGPAFSPTDPVDGGLVSGVGDDDSLNITQATLTASSSKGIVATLTGPSIGALPPLSADGDGATFYVAWLSTAAGKDIVYYAQATESPTGSWTFSSGNTGVYGSGSYSFTDTPTSAATGSVDTDTGTITIDLPASEVGSPAKGSLLSDPQAFVQDDIGTPVVSLPATVDSADNLVPTSRPTGCATGNLPSDCGLSQSMGIAVSVGS